jgi:hypothetical protein
MQQWVKDSKTMTSGVMTIVWGILILFGFAQPGSTPPQTYDGLGKPQSKQASPLQTIIGLGALGSGGFTLKGRADAQKKIEGKSNEKD